MHAIRRKSVCAVALSLALSVPSLALAGDITATLTLEKPALNADEDVYVTLTLTNTSAEPARLLKWAVPGEEMAAHVFEVSRDGHALQYLGAEPKRPAPTDKDFLSLAPGQSLIRRVELSRDYDLGITGQYAIAYDVAMVNLYNRSSRASLQSTSPSLQSVTSNRVSLSMLGRTPSWQDKLGLARVPVSQAADVGIASLTTANCSNTRAAEIATAFESAKLYGSLSLNYFNAGTQDARYTTWFGSYTSSRYATVRSHFERVDDALRTKNVVVDCNCTAYPSAYAYVYPAQPYRIYVCGAFWPAPNTGTDSKAGTLIHELTHFTVVGGTSDHAYGHSAAKALANSDPARAVMNADNHEYFAETGGTGGGGGNQAPNANFTSVVNGLNVSFTDSSTDSDGSIVSRNWNFGDGTSSTETNPSHSYASAGSYSVVLTVTDDKGLTGTRSQTVSVGGGGGGECEGSAESGVFSSSTREYKIHPGGRWYQSTGSGTHSACLTGPAGVDFDLYFERWNGSSWTRVASGVGDTANEKTSYSGAAGYYRYRVTNYRGSGSYTLTIKKP